ncbi:hypothetical protein E3T61_20955 [Cryobacterium lactosi]|uniref:Peptidase n=1 Tax=Cryobacterium lactosi TaxID=1259202 RepID=A0A4R9BFV6_9MICO|nr:hypothetical protein [Cryobacterium lactosi]TFD83511.1 hypothetical protein E3T61_20955 [Cryobacterium lactosi]
MEPRKRHVTLRLLLTVFTIVLLNIFAATSVPAAGSTSGFTTQERTATADEGIGIRLLDVPKAAQNDPRARSYIVDNLPPGTTIDRRAQLANHSASPLSVTVYAGSARIESGSFIGDEGDTVNELTTWTTLSESQLTLQARATADVTITVAVPGDASSGERYAAVWAEVRAPSDEDTTIINASRVGIRMYVSVGAGNGEATDFSIGTVEASRTPEGLPQVTATLTNTGGRALDVVGSLTLTEGPSGLSAGPFPTENATTLAPGDQGQVVVTLEEGFPAGPWQAVLTLQSGLIEHEATAEITFPRAGQTVTLATGNGLNMWPVVVVSLGILVFLTFVTMMWARRQRRR